jgi:hypothetical protein
MPSNGAIRQEKKVPENLADARKDAIKQVLSTSWQWTKPGELGDWKGRRKNADPMMVRGNGLERSLSQDCRVGQRKPSLGRECTVRKNRTEQSEMKCVAGTGVSGDEEMVKVDVEFVERKSAEFVFVKRPSISSPKEFFESVRSA